MHEKSQFSYLIQFRQFLQFEYSEEITMLLIGNVKQKSPKTITHKTLI